MTILDNELVRKYFGCRAVCTEAHFINVGYDEHERCMSFRILAAMQQPIRKGERYLWWFSDKVEEKISDVDSLGCDETAHPHCLRLPDAHQKQDSKCHCPNYMWHVDHTMCPLNHPTPRPNLRTANEIGQGVWPSGTSPEKSSQDPRCKCTMRPCWHGESPKDAVEEKIIEIEKLIPSNYIFGLIEKKLRDLVRLARETKPEMRSSDKFA